MLLAKTAGRNPFFRKIGKFQQAILKKWGNRRPSRQSFGWDLRKFNVFTKHRLSVSAGHNPKMTNNVILVPQYCFFVFFSPRPWD